MPRPGRKAATLTDSDWEALQRLTGKTGVEAVRHAIKIAKKEAKRPSDAGIDPVGADKSLQTTPSGFPPQAMKDEASLNNEPAPEPPQVLKRVEAQREIYEMKMNLEKEKQRTKLTRPPRSVNQSTRSSSSVDNWDFQAPASTPTSRKDDPAPYHSLVSGGCGFWHQADKPCPVPSEPEKSEWPSLENWNGVQWNLPK